MYGNGSTTFFETYMICVYVFEVRRISEIKKINS